MSPERRQRNEAETAKMLDPAAKGTQDALLDACYIAAGDHYVGGNYPKARAAIRRYGEAIRAEAAAERDFEWREYVLADPDTLTSDAKELAAKVLGAPLAPWLAAEAKGAADEAADILTEISAFLTSKGENRAECLVRARLEKRSSMVEWTKAEAEQVCWHCGDVLKPLPRPRCERCPDECDDEDCDAPGCADGGKGG